MLIKNLTNDDDGAIGNHIVMELTNIDLSKERDGKLFALFVVPSKGGYGFYVNCLRMDNTSNRYHLTSEPKYFSFEDKGLDTFFDGGR